MIAVGEHAGAEFEHALALHLGGNRRIRSINCRPSPNRSSFFVDDLEVRLDDGTSLELVAKAVRWDAMSPEARRAKPAFLWDPDRERLSYEAILTRFDVGAARYFGSYVSRSGTRYLLLERVAGTPLWQHGNFEAWREAARWLARLHVRVRAEAALGSRAAAHLLRCDRRFYDRWVARAHAFHDGLRNAAEAFRETGRNAAEAFRETGRNAAKAFRETGPANLAALTRRHAHVVEWLLAEPATFIHGEFYAANVLIENTDSDSAFVVRPIDWEMAAVGPALMDLACLLAGKWTDDDRADVADAYFQERALQGARAPARERYLKTLDLCLVHLSIRNLGWSRDWVPPTDRAHDWLSEGLRLCDRWQL